MEGAPYLPIVCGCECECECGKRCVRESVDGHAKRVLLCLPIVCGYVYECGQRGVRERVDGHDGQAHCRPQLCAVG